MKYEIPLAIGIGVLIIGGGIALVGMAGESRLGNLVREEKVATNVGVFTIQVFQHLLSDGFGIEILGPTGSRVESRLTRSDSAWPTVDEALVDGRLGVERIVLEARIEQINQELSA